MAKLDRMVLRKPFPTGLTRAGIFMPRRSVLHLGLGVLGILAASDALGAQDKHPTAAGLVPPDSVLETPYTFERGGLTIHGTIATPKRANGAVPVVLMVAGSGSTDRNSNGPAVNTNTYAMLAWGLAAHGIASLRYDKRAIGASRTGIDMNALTALTTDDYVADVRAAADSLAADARFSSVILLGHSEGAGHVLQAANRGAPAAGVVMVSGMGRRLAQVLHEQFSLQTDSATVTRADSAFARFLRGEPTPDVPPIAQAVTLPMYRTFLRSLAAYDPVEEARRLNRPLLIIQGTTDVQITKRDAELLAAAQPAATVVWLPNVNHVLKTIESTNLEAQLATYRDPSLPLAPDVVPAIARFIRGLPR